MAFSVTANPPSLGTLNSGDSVEVTFTFAGVPLELTDTATVPFQLGSESVTVALAVTLEEPDPIVGAITVPSGVTATVLSIDDVTAVVLFARS